MRFREVREVQELKSDFMDIVNYILSVDLSDVRVTLDEEDLNIFKDIYFRSDASKLIRFCKSKTASIDAIWVATYIGNRLNVLGCKNDYPAETRYYLLDKFRNDMSYINKLNIATAKAIVERNLEKQRRMNKQVESLPDKIEI